MPISEINGVNINWQVIGDRGPWIAMTTGGRRGHDEFVPLASKLGARGYRVMLHDRRNTGASDVLLHGEEGEEIIWTRDLYELMLQNDALPAFFSGGSSGARTSILFYMKYPQAVRGLLLMRVTGGAFAAGRLPENYYGQFIRAAEVGGMKAVCAMDQWKERMTSNERNRDYLSKLPASTFIEVMKQWHEVFLAGANHPVMGVSQEELEQIRVPTLIIPGNDKVHSSASAVAAHNHISGSKLHRLPIEDQDIPLIPFPEWAEHEEEIAHVFNEFMKNLSGSRP